MRRTITHQPNSRKTSFWTPSKVLRTYREHLQKYRQVEGRTTGETNRLERELQHMRNILRGRGREFGPEGDILE